MKAQRHGSHTLVAPPRRVLVAPDKFKGTMTSEQAAHAIVRGLRQAWPEARFTCLGLSDGGDGFARLLTRAAGGRLRRVRTNDAAGRPCRVEWGMLGDGRTAVLDLAAASGLAQLPSHLRDPRYTSTFGAGRVLQAAIRSRATTIIVGLGGSATNDGGVGLAACAGWKFLDHRGREIALNGVGLLALHRIVPPVTRLRARIVAATDVDNPLHGPRGAACQFAQQKGASPAAVRTLDLGLRRLAQVARRDLGVDLARTPGAGAAGGCGFGLLAFFGAALQPGFEVFRRRSQLDVFLERHDMVVTGEGCFDVTSLAGKGPWRLAQLAGARGKTVLGVFGKTVTRPPAPFAQSVAIVEDGQRVPLATVSEHRNRLTAASCRLALEYTGLGWFDARHEGSRGMRRGRPLSTSGQFS